jgi:hypothetical protein
MTVVLYPREVICGGCGASIMLSWISPFGRGSEEPVYNHPDFKGCEFNGKTLKPTGIFAGVMSEEETP